MDSFLKIASSLKDPALIIATIVIGALFYLVVWLVKNKDKAILDVVSKIDTHTSVVAKLTTMLETLIGIGRIK